MDFLLVGIGGFLGAVSRYLIYLTLGSSHRFPFATLAVNLVGCLALGVILGWTARNGSTFNGLSLLLITGFLGAFTTFSAFGFETLNLMQRGDVALAALYVGLSVVGGVAAVFLGRLF